MRHLIIARTVEEFLGEVCVDDTSEEEYVDYTSEEVSVQPIGPRDNYSDHIMIDRSKKHPSYLLHIYHG